MVGIWPCCVTVGFDLRQVLATDPGNVEVWACVDEKCVGHWVTANSMSLRGSSTGTTAHLVHLVETGWSYDGDTFWVYKAEVNDPQVDVRLIVRDQGRVLFDTTSMLRLYESWPNGPGCTPVLIGGTVLATPEGDLILRVDETLRGGELLNRLRGGPNPPGGARRDAAGV
jgi:hypothetical protein